MFAPTSPLMFDPNEDDHQLLEVQLRRMVAEIQYEKGKKGTSSNLHAEVIALSRGIVKREWDRVKEPFW